MPRYEMETIGAEPRAFGLRGLCAGALTVAVTGGFLAVLLVQTAQTPAPRPPAAAERVSNEAAMDWRPDPEFRLAAAPAE
jgi:hypothetical protein